MSKVFVVSRNIFELSKSVWAWSVHTWGDITESILLCTKRMFGGNYVKVAKQGLNWTAAFDQIHDIITILFTSLRFFNGWNVASVHLCEYLAFHHNIICQTKYTSPKETILLCLTLGENNWVPLWIGVLGLGISYSGHKAPAAETNVPTSRWRAPQNTKLTASSSLFPAISHCISLRKLPLPGGRGHRQSPHSMEL